MIQFYLLAVVMNILGGLFIAAPMLKDKVSALQGIQEALRLNISTRIILIILSLAVGVFKLLSVTQGDVAVVGDLLPALGLLTLAAVLFLDYYTEQSEVRSSWLEGLQKVFVGQKSLIGLILIVIGLLHFLFPKVLFL
ncbi:MAG TPA: hypothetical protein ENN41_00030 [Sediminispirochaeta sp.]|nr:hypothetical protein [Sediminispirochaeta sp.]